MFTKGKPPSQTLQVILRFFKTGVIFTQNRTPKLEGSVSSSADELYISTYLDAWCYIFLRLNGHALQGPSFGENKGPVRTRRLWVTGIWNFSERINTSNIYAQ